jgi:tyrosine-specific transport protein
MHQKTLSTFGATLIVAGTSIGAGMLGLPVLLAQGGFFPALIVLGSSFLFMLATGLLYAELCLWLGGQVHMLSMAKRTLGRWGWHLAFFLYLFLFYSLLVAYFVGGGNLLNDLLPISPSSSILLFAALFITIVAFAHRVVDPLNRLCMVGLFVAYFSFVFIGIRLIDPKLLTRVDFFGAWVGLPIAFTSFGYQGTIPTLASWLGYDARRLRSSIIWGTSITFTIYALWVALILGIVPFTGPHGLFETMQAGRDATHPLQYFSQNPLCSIMGRIFAFFAIATSFLGVGIGLVDFWADGLKIKNRTLRVHIALLALAFLVPLIFAICYPGIFLKALGVAGGFGSALLLGALPVAMIYFSKKERKMWYEKSGFLFVLFSFFLFEIILETLQLM